MGATVSRLGIRDPPTIAKGIQQRLNSFADSVLPPIGRGVSIGGRRFCGRRWNKSVLANVAVDVDDVTWWTFHRGDRGLPVSRPEHAAHAKGRTYAYDRWGPWATAKGYREGVVSARGKEDRDWCGSRIQGGKFGR